MPLQLRLNLPGKYLVTDSVPAPSHPPNRNDKAAPPAGNGQPSAGRPIADPAVTAAAEAVAHAASSIAKAAGSVAAAAAPGAEVSLDRQRITDLIAQIKESADKLAADQPSRGDLKILSRTLRELRYAFKVFSPYRSRRKVTVFGSARTRPDEATYQQAVEFGREMAEHGWLVVTGAASGIMEAGHVGAGRENSMGLNIMLPFEQSANPIIAGDPKLVHMKYFFTRKLMFVKECDAVVLFPGGFGTLDEGLEVLTLLQTGKRDMVPVVFLDEPGGEYWQPLVQFFKNELLGARHDLADDLSLYSVTDSVDDAVRGNPAVLPQYHSMRYVKNKLVFRLHDPISAELLADINENFRDILTDGEFTQGGPLREEKDEPALIALPRLIFHFNRRSLGRLRQLIDTLNRGSVID